MIDVDRIIDMHTHAATDIRLDHGLGKDILEETGEYFGHEMVVESIEETVQMYEDLGIDTVVLFAMDTETSTGNPPISNEWVAEVCDEYDLFRGFACVDPHKGQIAIDRAREAIETLDLDGFKFQQTTQAFNPSEERFAPLWRTLEDLGKPVLFHGGMTGIAAGTPGGRGFKLGHSRPIHIDHVAAEHPEMPIIIAHPAWPWHQEQLAIVQHKGNVYMDLSGWRPKYIPEEVKQYVRTRISDKVLFGSDYPVVDPETWLSDFEEWDLSEEVRRKILYENAAELIGI